MTKFNTLLYIIIFFSVSLTYAQTKNEKESRITISQFPERSQILLKNLPKKSKRIRFYQETDGQKLSYESKFKYYKFWFSIEFHNDGTLEDIEKTVKKKHLPKLILNALHSYSNAIASKYDIIKIQEQYLYTTKISEVQFLKSIIKQNTSVTSNYEIIMALKIDNVWELQEITFDSTGHFMTARTLKQNSYEYIMY